MNEQQDNQYLHRQSMALPPPVQNNEQNQGPGPKRKLFWPIFLAVMLTASLTLVATIAVGYMLYGNTIKDATGGITAGTKPHQTTQPTGNSGVGTGEDFRTLTFTDAEGLEESLSKFTSVYNLLQENYYKEFSDAEMIDKMLEGLVGQMGSPYTFYLTPEYHETVEDSMKGEYVGIGAIVMHDRDNTYVVNDIIPDSPAEKAGLYVGDIFLKVDDRDALQFEDVAELAVYVRGEAGTPVTLVVYRPLENREVTLTITRRAIKNASVRFRMLEQGVGYIHMTEFSDHAAENFENAVLDLMNQGAQHLVIDLRNNGGGYAHECVNMLDVLLPRVTVATIKGREDGKVYEDQWKTKTAALVPDDMTYVILLNKYSASASELFSGAMRDLKKAVIVGQTSYGKGVGTMMWQLEDNSAVQITGFEYFLPNGGSVEEVGLVPDYEVELPPEVEIKAPNRRTIEEDTQLQKALEILLPRVK
ncbi:MAG: S41 family peptidase [Clostridiaceae bacterium]|nr:S41 family peptidase [Clostridiaceae bacterium]